MALARASLVALLLCAATIPPGCTTGVEPSPNPGTLRVTLKGVESDTMIVIQNDTSEFSRWDNFYLMLSQGRVYRGENYAVLYNNPSSARKPDDTVNILAREWLDGTPITILDTAKITPQNSRWVKYMIFESYAPPGTYDRLFFGMTAEEMEIFIPKHYLNPVQFPPGEDPGLDFVGSFVVEEGKTTEIQIEMSPYASLSRYKDSFYFTPKVLVVGTTVQ